jgi:hypothetical protein
VYLAWTYGEDAAADVEVATRSGDAFGAPVAIAKTPTYSDAPKLVVDASGVLHVAYAETSGGPFDPARILYTRSRDGKTFEPSTTIADGAFPALAIDDGRIVVIWEVAADEGRARGLGYATSRDGTKFSRAARVPHSRDDGFNGSHQGHLMNKLALRDRTIAIVNSSLEQGKQSRVWMIRGRL